MGRLLLSHRKERTEEGRYAKKVMGKRLQMPASHPCTCVSFAREARVTSASSPVCQGLLPFLPLKWLSSSNPQG